MRKTIVIFFATGFFTNLAGAIEIADNLSVKGFATLGLTHSDNQRADFVANRYFYPQGAGYNDNLTINVDSRAGVQIDWQATPGVSLTGQLLSRQFASGDWIPQLEWAFAKVNIIPNADLRFGRIRPAIYLLSDYLDVNYANPWIRPPIEFYSPAPMTRMEGIDLLWRPTTGELSWLVQPYIGKTKIDLTSDTQLEVNKIRGINVTTTVKDFTFRGGYIETYLTANAPRFTAAFNGLSLICARGDNIACNQIPLLIPENKKSTFASLGLGWDNGQQFLSGEWGKRESDSSIATTTSWYLSGGSRLGKWTPYLTYSQLMNNSPTIFTNGLTSLTNTIITALRLNNPMDQTTTTLGLRYDVAKNTALKVQWDHVNTHCQSISQGTCGGLFVEQQPGFSNSPQNANLVSLAIDVVF